MSTCRQVLPDGRVVTAGAASPSPRRSRRQQQQAKPAPGSVHESSPRRVGRVSPRPRGRHLASGWQCSQRTLGSHRVLRGCLPEIGTGFRRD